MAAGEADRRADAVGVEERSAVRCPLMKAVHQLPPDLTMMVEEAPGPHRTATARPRSAR